MRNMRRMVIILWVVAVMAGAIALAPVTTARAEDTVKGTIYKWVKGEVVAADSFIYNFGDLHTMMGFFLMNSNAEPVYGPDPWTYGLSWLGQTEKLYKPYNITGEKGYLYKISFDYGQLSGNWSDFLFGRKSWVYVQADRYIMDHANLWAYTWKDNVTLTRVPEKAATEKEPGNIEYFTDADNRYYLKDSNGKYNEVSQEDVEIPSVAVPTPYVALNGSTQEKLAFPISKVGGDTLDKSWYFVNENKEFSWRLKVQGNVNLILKDGYTLTVRRGISVDAGNSLTIWAQEKGTGKLVADWTESQMPGIGGSGKGVNSGAITINGGIITVNGGSNAAGIGGAENAKGTVVINGGQITANGGSGAAGIGDGVGYSDSEVTLDWRKDTDWIKASSYSGTVTLKRAFSVEGGSVLHNGVVSDLSTIDGKTLNAHVHSFPDAEHKAHKDPTDYIPGNIEYWRCSKCGYYYSDIDGYNEVTEAETVIPPLNGMLKEGMYAVGDTLPLIAGTKIALADGSTVTISENTMLDISYENKSLKVGNNVVDSVDGSGMSFIGRCLVQHDSGRDVYTVKKLCYNPSLSVRNWQKPRGIRVFGMFFHNFLVTPEFIAKTPAIYKGFSQF